MAQITTSASLDSHLLTTLRQEHISRKLWLYFSLTMLASIGVFIAMQ